MNDVLIVNENEWKEESRFSRLLKDERGLSLVELLAVVVILAIIAGIGVVAIGGVIQNSREDAAVGNVQQAFSAAVLYQSTNLNLNSSSSATTFTLKDVNDAGLLDNTAGWSTAALGSAGNTAVTFAVAKDGKLTVNVPGGSLSAGQKSSAPLTNYTQSQVGSLTRSTLFSSTNSSTSN